MSTEKNVGRKCQRSKQFWPAQTMCSQSMSNQWWIQCQHPNDEAALNCKRAKKDLWKPFQTARTHQIQKSRTPNMKQWGNEAIIIIEKRIQIVENYSDVQQYFLFIYSLKKDPTWEWKKLKNNPSNRVYISNQHHLFNSIVRNEFS